MKRTVLITGAAGGIGSETALQFAREGYSVAAHYNRSQAQAKALVAELAALGCDADCFGADISDGKQVEQMIAQVQSRFGRIDVLINNAAIAQQKLFSEISTADWEQMFGVNMTGIFHTCRGVLPQMIQEKSGKIINISSIWGICGASCEVHYSASKAAVIGFTKALAKEVGPSGIQVNCVAPGVISTKMNAALDEQTLCGLREETPLGIIGMPNDVAGLLCFLASEQANFITGQVISPNGGMVI